VAQQPGYPYRPRQLPGSYERGWVGAARVMAGRWMAIATARIESKILCTSVKRSR